MAAGFITMELVIANRILKNDKYRRLTAELAELERERPFCRHDMTHFLDVARIAVIFSGRSGTDISDDVIYSAALLHDLGRIEEIKSGMPHEIAGQVTAAGILAEVDCPEAMAAQIISLIANHRRRDNPKDSPEEIFFRADKRSRRCFECSAEAECDWTRKNLEIEV